MCDSELQAQYNELKALRQQLKDSEAEPSPSTVLNILSYSRSMPSGRQS
ncbi:MAG: hypothetical protein ACOYXA_11380 [Bacteroidota bacterium]